MTAPERRAPFVRRQERQDEIRNARNERLQQHRDALKAQREYQQRQKQMARDAEAADRLAQEHYQQEMSRRTGMSPIDTSKEA